MTNPASPRQPTVILGVAAWLTFVILCLWGAPPMVDLPAHGAQLQLMSDWLTGDEPTRQQFSLHVVLGYGLWYWCALPLAWLTSGAWAAKAVVGAYLLALPASLRFFFKQHQQPSWMTLVALPLSFSVSYWYGFVSTLVTLPALFLGLGLWTRWHTARQRADAWGTGACLAFCALNHPLSYAAMAAALLGSDLARDRSRRHLLRLVGLIAIPGLALVPLLLGSLEPHDARSTPGFAYRFDTHHLAWFWKNCRQEGLLSLLLPLGLVLAACVQRLSGRAPISPAFGACVGVAALYVLVPYHGGGAMMLDIRLPVVVAGLALASLKVETLSRWPRWAFWAASLACLLEAGLAHRRFGAFVEPAASVFLDQRTEHSTTNVVSIPPFTRHPFLEHFFEWETARHGGFGDQLFADAHHVPIQARRGAPWPAPAIRYGYGVPQSMLGCVREAESSGFSRWRCVPAATAR